MKNLFIDTNIWLSLYHFSNDDLVQFNKLKERIGTEINLIIPIQVYHEIIRNRETKLKDSLKEFSITSIPYPAFCKGYEEYEPFKNDYNAIIQRFNSWNQRIKEDIKNRRLPADITIREFFERVNILNCDEFVEKAVIRYKVGNPPGKENKYGDAINWECLLSVVPDNEDLYFISADKDYQSILFKGQLDSYLGLEWNSKKNSKIYFYTNLVSFLSEHIKDIELQTEREKQSLIDQLSNSISFQNTHGIIAMLSKYSGWTESQIEQMCLAAEENEQVNRILSDKDIFLFYSNLLSHLDYDKLEDSATKRVMYIYYGDAIEGYTYEEDYDEDEYPTDMFG